MTTNPKERQDEVWDLARRTLDPDRVAKLLLDSLDDDFGRAVRVLMEEGQNCRIATMVIEEQDLGEQEAAFDAEGDLARARQQPPTSTRHILTAMASRHYRWPTGEILSGVWIPPRTLREGEELIRVIADHDTQLRLNQQLANLLIRGRVED